MPVPYPSSWSHPPRVGNYYGGREVVEMTTDYYSREYIVKYADGEIVRYTPPPQTGGRKIRKAKKNTLKNRRVIKKSRKNRR